MTTEKKKGSGIYTCYPNWICNEWSECINGNKTRICNDQNRCQYPYTNKTETKSCITELKGVDSTEKDTEAGTEKDISSSIAQEESPAGITAIVVSGAINAWKIFWYLKIWLILIILLIIFYIHLLKSIHVSGNVCS